MNVEESLYARLAAHAGTAALVGTRIYPVELPQTPTLSAITYRMASQPTEHIFTEAASDVKASNFQIQCWAETYSGAQALGVQVEAALDAFAGLLGGAGGYRCWVTLTNAIDLGDDATDWKRRILEFEIWG